MMLLNLELQLDDLALEILCECIGAWGFPLENLIKGDFCTHLEFVLAF